jgi:hypothetical protein
MAQINVGILAKIVLLCNTLKDTAGALENRLDNVHRGRRGPTAWQELLASGWRVVRSHDERAV